MRNIFQNRNGFTLTEVIFVAVITSLLVASVGSAWVFTHRTWSGERQKTAMRIELLTAVETLKNDLRLSSDDHLHMMSYAAGGKEFTAIIMPQAERDKDGFFKITMGVDEREEINWDKTVLYHVDYENGKAGLLRTVLDSWDGSLDREGKEEVLEKLIAGTLNWDSRAVVVKDFIENFRITPLPREVDFYSPSGDPEKFSDVVFGTVYVTPGEHTLRFVVSGKNDASSGYSFALDNIRIDPSDSKREAEYYISSHAPGWMFTSGGVTVERIYDTLYSNHNYLKVSASAEGDYIEFTDYYDLWRESAFENASFYNVIFYGEERRAKIASPFDAAEGQDDIYGVDVVWESFAVTNSMGTDIQEDAHLEGYVKKVKTVIANDHIDTSGTTDDYTVRGDVIRVKFLASSDASLIIDKAYAAISTGEGGYTGKVPLFEDITIPEGGYYWSDWIEFDLDLRDTYDNPVDYMIIAYFGGVDEDQEYRAWEGEGAETYVTRIFFNECDIDASEDKVLAPHDLSAGDMVYFYGEDLPSGITPWPSRESPYYVVEADDPDNEWFKVSGSLGGAPITFDKSIQEALFFMAGDMSEKEEAVIYAIAEIDAWRTKGTVESRIFDTKVGSPSFGQISWNEYRPSGTEITMKVRSDNSFDMTGATDWKNISGSSGNPHSPAAGIGRYVQFLAEIEVDPFKWEAWIDDVEIDWYGPSRRCFIKADIVKKNDHGKVYVEFDGSPLSLGYEVNVSVESEHFGRTLHEEKVFSVEALNTGR